MFKILVYNKNKTSVYGIYEFEYMETELRYYFVANKWIGHMYDYITISNRLFEKL